MFLKNVMGGGKWCGKYTLELYILHLHIYGLILKSHPYGTNEYWGINFEFLEISTAVILSLLLCYPVHWISHLICDKIRL